MTAQDQSVVVAKHSFACEVDGLPVYVPRGAVVRVGHPVLEGREHLFGPIVVDFEYEAPAAKPGARKP